MRTQNTKEFGILDALENAAANGGTVTYHFEDGTKQITNLNKETFLTDRGKKRSLTDVLGTLNDTMYDLGATSLSV
jgi:hypothetical protein